MKILVVDDHALVREGLSQVLTDLDEALTVLQAGTCTLAFEIASQHPDLDLVLLDYHLPDMNGLDALQVFARRHPEIPVLMLSGSASEKVLRQVMQRGAAGFLLKSGMTDELLQAVRIVLNGGVYFPYAIEPSRSPPLPPEEALLAKLSPRQLQVLQCMVNGYSNKKISDTLHVSEETVKSHVTAILRNLGVENRTQAVMTGARMGFQPENVG